MQFVYCLFCFFCLVVAIFFFCWTVQGMLTARDSPDGGSILLASLTVSNFEGHISILGTEHTAGILGQYTLRFSQFSQYHDFKSLSTRYVPVLEASGALKYLVDRSTRV